MPKRRRIMLGLAWILIPLFTLVSQSAMKIVAEHTGTIAFGLDWLAIAAQSIWVYVLVGAELASFLIWMFVLAHVDISRAVPLTSIAYVLILCAAAFIFHEHLTIFQYFGASLILFGVWLISTAPKHVNT